MMKLFENLYSPNEAEVASGRQEQSYLTYDHFFVDTEAYRYDERKNDPVLTLRGWRTLFAILVGMLIFGALMVFFDSDVHAESSTTNVKQDDWDLIYDDTRADASTLVVETIPKQDEFPETVRYSGPVVGRIQGALTELGYYIQDSELSNERFGPTMATAVKEFQIDYGLEPTGWVKTEEMQWLGFGAVEVELRYEADLASIAAGSTSGYLYYIANNPRKFSGPVLSVFERVYDGTNGWPYWRLIKQGFAAVGTCTDYDSITPVGKFSRTYAKKKGDELVGGKQYFFEVGFYSDQLAILSVGKIPETGEFENWVVDPDNYIRRDCKGRLTGGSVRVSYDLARWLYEQSDENTIIVIDDRNYDG